LTFLAGVYGMNFKHMPEIGWPWSYPILWLVMLGVAGVMVYFFKKKNWL
jgi:magnesium transporter